MILDVLLGVLVGIILSGPYGPMALLAIMHVSHGHLRAALSLALGVCMADMLLTYISIEISNYFDTFVESNVMLFNYAAIVVVGALLVMGWFGWKNANLLPKPAKSRVSLPTGFAMTFFHPGNIGAFVASFALLTSYGYDFTDELSHILVSVGVLLGGLIVWVSLLLYVNKIKSNWKPKTLVKLRKCVALLFFVCAFAVAYSSAQAYYFS